MNTQELLKQLRDKGWSDAQIARPLGMDRITVWRWRMGITAPHSERPVMRMLKELLRRQRVPRKKQVA